MHDFTFPITVEKDGEGYFGHISHPNGTFQGVTDGASVAEVLENAVDMLREMISAAVVNGEDIPSPGSCAAGTHEVTADALTSAKAQLHLALRAQGLKQGDLGARMKGDYKAAKRLLDFKHRSKAEHLEQAFRAVGYRLHVSAAPLDNGQ